MPTILGLTPTGRELRDPSARLVEATGEDGRTYTVVDFDAVHDGHPALTLNVELVLSFMEYPMVTGLVELAKHDVAQGHFAYPTGSVWLLADVLRAYGDFGQVVGLRAAMELAWLVGQILVEAGETGPMQGCFSHGNLNPWRVALRADGEVQVLGYGLPQVELIRHRDEEGPPIDARSLFYCPPERLEGVPEDSAADTYALTLLCYEVATGKPLYRTHDVPELERMVGMSEGAGMLSREDLGLPSKVAKVLAKSLIYDPETRLSGQDYVDAIGQLLATQHMDGPSLTEVVDVLQGQQKAGAPKGRKLVSADTSMFTPEQLAELADEEDDEEEEGDAPDDRWKKVTRSRNEDDEDDDGKRRTRRRSEADAPKPKRRRKRGSDDDDKGSKRRRRPKAEDEGPPEEPDEPADASDEEEDERPSRRRRRRTSDEEEEKPAKRSRRRRPAADEEEDEGSGDGDEGSDDTVDEKSTGRRRKAPKGKKKTSRRRKAPAGGGDDTEDDAPAKTSRRRKAPEDDDVDESAKSSRRRKAPQDEGDDDSASASKSSRRRKAPRGDGDGDDASSEKASKTSRRRKAPEDDASDGDEEAPTRPSRRRKAPEDDASEGQEAGSPRRRRRRSVDDDEEEEAPRRRRRRKVDDEEEEDEAPPRRRRRKKS